METAIKNIEKSNFGIFTIEKDFDQFTVKITRPSKGKYQLGTKNVHYISFRLYKEDSMKIMKMNLFVDEFINDQTKIKSEKTAEKLALQNARKNFKNPYEVGQILYNSWGYEQTNVNFYQIVEVKAKSIVIQEIDQERQYSQSDAGTCMPIKDSFASEKQIVKMITIRVYDGKVNYYVHLSTWDGKPKSWSSYH